MNKETPLTWLVGVLLLDLSAAARAETPVVEWIRQLGSGTTDYGHGVSVDGSGNAYVTGWTWGSLDGNTSAGLADMFLTKYDTSGVKQWTKQLGTTGEDHGRGVSVDGSGNAFVAGYTYRGLDGNTSAGYVDVFLTKYDTNGAKLWTRQLGTAKQDAGQGVSVDGAGNAYVAGGTYGDLDGNSAAGNGDMFLTKYDTDGVKLWTRQLGTANTDIGEGVSIDGSGNAYVTGYTGSGLDGNTGAGSTDVFLTKYNMNGVKQWTKQLGTAHWDDGCGVSVDEAGNAYVTGYTAGGLDGNTGAGGYDVFLTKYDTNGVKLWTRQLGRVSYDYGRGVSVDGSGNAYVTGYTEGSIDGSINAGDEDIFLAKYDTNGAKLWTWQLGTADSDGGYGVSVDGSGCVYVTGWTEGSLDGNTNAGSYDMFLIKISSVPEPGSMALLAAIVLTALLCRKHRDV